MWGPWPYASPYSRNGTSRLQSRKEQPRGVGNQPTRQESRGAEAEQALALCAWFAPSEQGASCAITGSVVLSVISKITANYPEVHFNFYCCRPCNFRNSPKFCSFSRFWAGCTFLVNPLEFVITWDLDNLLNIHACLDYQRKFLINLTVKDTLRLTASHTCVQ